MCTVKYIRRGKVICTQSALCSQEVMMLFLAGTGPSHDLVVKAERAIWKGKHGLNLLLNLITAMFYFFSLALCKYLTASASVWPAVLFALKEPQQTSKTGKQLDLIFVLQRLASWTQKRQMIGWGGWSLPLQIEVRHMGRKKQICKIISPGLEKETWKTNSLKAQVVAFGRKNVNSHFLILFLSFQDLCEKADVESQLAIK